jgi:hypothetical protein
LNFTREKAWKRLDISEFTIVGWKMGKTEREVAFIPDILQSLGTESVA